ncbi:MAG TPA: CsgG/HfaB family protein [Luteitalea sp.]|nr:CsgG/HfaB family protein [Luteitalea sp.]
MRRVLTHLTALITTLVVCALLTPTAFADTIRVVAAKANVRLNAVDTSPVMLALTAGTVLDEATREGAWFRVTLPADASGFRRVGYIAAALVEVLSASAPTVAAAASVAPVAVSLAAPPATPRSTESTTAVPVGRGETVAVMDFDYGTIRRWWSGDWDVGKGIADLMVDELVNGSSLRVIERKKLLEILSEQEFAASDRADVSAASVAKIGKMLGARYLIVGSITQFSHEQGGIGGGGRLAMVGGLGIKTSKAHVGISARMIDTSTGEIVASGNTKQTAQRRSVTGAGAAGGYGGGVSITSSDFLDTILGEATHAAIKSTTESLIASKARAR